MPADSDSDTLKKLTPSPKTPAFWWFPPFGVQAVICLAIVGVTLYFVTIQRAPLDPNEPIILSSQHLSNFFATPHDSQLERSLEGLKIVPSTCTYKFLRYEPSEYEKLWHENINSWQEIVCPTLALQYDEFLPVLSVVQDLSWHLPNDTSYFYRNFSESIKSKRSLKLLSRFVYEETCGDMKEEVVSLIEPIYGNTRDPLTICQYPPPGPPGAQPKFEQSKQHLLFHDQLKLDRSGVPSSDPYLSHRSPQPLRLLQEFYNDESRHNDRRDQITNFKFFSPPYRSAVLMDLGSSRWLSNVTEASFESTHFLYSEYANRGIIFDRILAFEVEPTPGRDYWKQIPPRVLPKLQFYNVPISKDESSNVHPWTLLKNLVTREDFVVVKLDIDAPVIELTLMIQLMGHPDYVELVDEMFFEHHVHLPELFSHWGKIEGYFLNDTYHYFTSLREKGLRMHSWP